MINEAILKKNIMTRVKTIYWGRVLFVPGVSLIIWVGFILAAKALIFWQSVVANMATAPIYQWPLYILNAFDGTNFIVQIVLVGFFILGLKIVRDLLNLYAFVISRRMV